jgi:hypothetical protein
MSLETAIQQLKDAVTGETQGLDARVAAAPAEIQRGQEAAANLAKAMPTGAADHKTSTSGFMLRVGRTHSIVGELHVAITHSGHISVAFRANRYGKPLPDEHWELTDPTAADPAAGEPWTRILTRFCERTSTLGATAG